MCCPFLINLLKNLFFFVKESNEHVLIAKQVFWEGICRSWQYDSKWSNVLKKLSNKWFEKKAAKSAK